MITPVKDLPKTILNYYNAGSPIGLVGPHATQEEIDAVFAVETSNDPEKLKRWSLHKAHWIRAATATNLCTPEEALDVLCFDLAGWIRDLAMSNPNTSEATKIYVKMGGYGEMTLEQFKETVKL